MGASSPSVVYTKDPYSPGYAFGDLLPLLYHARGTGLVSANLYNMSLIIVIKRAFYFCRYPLMAFLCSRIALFLVVYLGLALVPVSAQGVWRHFPGNLFLDGFSRFDSGWYLSIAIKGYTNLPNLEGQRDTAFFPGFPYVLAILGRFFSLSDAQGLGLAGIMISNLCFLFSLCILYSLAHRYFSKPVAQLSVGMMAFSPFAVFFSAVYAESLFLFAAMASFWLSARE
jgi:hypothetical protein